MAEETVTWVKNKISQPVNRIGWIDECRFLTLFLVIFYHTPPRMEIMTERAMWHILMATFFFVSGICFDGRRLEGISTFVCRRVRRLLLPYFTLSVSIYILWLLGGRCWAGGADMSARWFAPLVELIEGRPSLVAAALWFICALFLCQILFFMLCKIMGSKPMPLLFVSFFLFLVPVLGDWECTRYWQLDYALLFMPFYAVGTCGRTIWLSWMRQKNHFNLQWVISVLIAGCSFVWAAETDSIWIRTLASFGVIPFLLLTSDALFSLCKSRCVSRFVQFVNRYSVAVLAFQSYVIAIVVKGVFFLSGREGAGDWSAKWLIAALSMMATCVLIDILRRFFPWILGERFARKT
ncbi:MAG TPA: acyltransferase family protein [Alloprevotella sp.]|nr:acyltransferase family protein [Alloprevotella sp.]